MRHSCSQSSCYSSPTNSSHYCEHVVSWVHRRYHVCRRDRDEKARYVPPLSLSVDHVIYSIRTELDQASNQTPNWQHTNLSSISPIHRLSYLIQRPSSGRPTIRYHIRPFDVPMCVTPCFLSPSRANSKKPNFNNASAVTFVGLI
jgi:hypothetical protein